MLRLLVEVRCAEPELFELLADGPPDAALACELFLARVEAGRLAAASPFVALEPAERVRVALFEGAWRLAERVPLARDAAPDLGDPPASLLDAEPEAAALSAGRWAFALRAFGGSGSAAAPLAARALLGRFESLLSGLLRRAVGF